MNQAQTDLLDDVIDSIKYQLLRNLIVFFFSGLFVSSIFILFSKEVVRTPNIMGVCLFAMCFFLLRKTKNYKLVAIISSGTAVFILAYTFLGIRASHFLSPLWMLLNVLFSFFLVGRNWGIFVSVTHFLVYYIFILTVENQGFILPSSFSGYDIVSYSIQLSIVFSSFIYILTQYIKSMKLTEESMKNLNRKLLQNNALVSKQNTEMELMLKEIHHRVKNNMQIISSLLRLEANKATEKSGTFYQEAIDRVSAMALVHEKMYKSGVLSQFDLEKYIQSLVSNLIDNYSLELKPQVDIKVNLKQLQQKSIVPFALLLNELLLNSLKHAFESHQNPLILIEINESSRDYLFDFIYFDNGTWQDEAIPSFGTEIIEAMVGQLDGRFNLEKTKSGTKYTFELHNE